MKYGIFSDIHGNLEAFKEALNFYQNQKIDKFIYLGDAIGYGASPNECLELLKTLDVVCIAGNHEWAAAEKMSLDLFSKHAREAALWSKKAITDKNFDYLANFKLTYNENDLICVHGSLDKPQEFHYVKDSISAEESFQMMEEKICFLGHTHRMEVFCLFDGKISCNKNYVIKLQSNCKYIVNVGSVGQPRDGDPRACLCVYDAIRKELNFTRVSYDIKKSANKILKEKLPVIIAERLYQGR